MNLPGLPRTNLRDLRRMKLRDRLRRNSGLARTVRTASRPCRFSPKNGDAIGIAIPSAGESHLQDELSPVNTVHRERGISGIAVYVL
jgi:hypothetical protein